MNWVIASVVAQAALLVYFQLHEWVHLPPWNDTEPGNRQGRLDVVMGVVQAGVIVGVGAESIPAMAVGVAAYAGWFALQAAGWWIPYLRGASDAHMRFYEQYWARTWRFLPPIGNHPVPNAAHVGLQLLILASVASTAAAFMATV